MKMKQSERIEKLYNQRLTKTDAAWFAGFIEGSGSGTPRKGKRRNMCMVEFRYSPNSKRLVILAKLAKMIGQKVGAAGTGRGQAESFHLNGRPAAFTDGFYPLVSVRIHHGQARNLIKQASPFMTKFTIDRFKKILTVAPMTYTERGKLGCSIKYGKNYMGAAS